VEIVGIFRRAPLRCARAFGRPEESFSFACPAFTPWRVQSMPYKKATRRGGFFTWRRLLKSSEKDFFVLKQTTLTTMSDRAPANTH
jgi:hypothetical protein